MIASLTGDTEVMKAFLKMGSKFDTEFLNNVQKQSFVAKGEEITLDDDEAQAEEADSTAIYAGLAIGALLVGGLMFFKMKR